MSFEHNKQNNIDKETKAKIRTYIQQTNSLAGLGMHLHACLEISKITNVRLTL